MGEDRWLGFRGLTVLAPVLLISGILYGQNLEQFEKQVTEFTLSNGLHFILVARHNAPVVSVRTWVDAGSADDPAGQTGLARMFQRMAFQGTESIGTTDWPSEKKALDALEQAADQLELEQNKGPRASQDRLEMLKLDLNSAMDRAQTYVRATEYGSILDSNGAQAFGAAATFDHTEYSCSLPSNRLELWFLMESQRLLAPVYRQFYQEREAAAEEARTQSNAQAMLLQDVVSTAFQAGPFHHPVAGWPADIESLRTRQAREFQERYYVPARMVIAMAGDVNPAECRRSAEHYFGGLPARPAPPPPHAAELPQRGPRAIQLDLPAPLLVYAFKRPSELSPEDPAFAVMNAVLSGGRGGLLYRELVETRRVAVDVRAIAAYPSGRFPCLFVFLLVPSRGHSMDELKQAFDALLDGFLSQNLDDEQLHRARNRIRASLLNQLNSNQGLSAILPAYYTAFGDWRQLFTWLDSVDKVTADDVLRVARRYLVASQRTVGFTSPPVPAVGER